jgi:sialic acid synthase SpsE
MAQMTPTARKKCERIKQHYTTAMSFPRVHGRTPGENVFIVAEIGKNFIQTEEDRDVEEYITNAKVLIDAAVESGVDAVKFQTHEVEDEQCDVHIVSPHFKGSDRYRWVKRNTEATPIHFWKAVKEHAEQRGVIFFTTPMSRAAARKIEPLNPPFWKIASGDVQDDLLIRELARTKKPIMISTGMVSITELDDVMMKLKKLCHETAVLYCVSQYPCPPEHFNLTTIEWFGKAYLDSIIGFSDHSIGYNVTLAAVKLGARVVEKHFSLSRDLWGSDHKVSMTPKEMEEMVHAIRSRAFESVDPTAYYGNRNQELEGAANPYRPYFNKRLVAGTDLEAGMVLTEDVLYAMRPSIGTEGLPSNALDDVLGKTIAKTLKKYDPITSDILQ